MTRSEETPAALPTGPAPTSPLTCEEAITIYTSARGVDDRQTHRLGLMNLCEESARRARAEVVAAIEAVPSSDIDDAYDRGGVEAVRAALLAAVRSAK